jgi:hypothetical protein
MYEDKKRAERVEAAAVDCQLIVISTHSRRSGLLHPKWR